MTKNFFILFILTFVYTVNAQNTELILEKGVKRHKRIDQIYAKFSQAYKNFDLDLVANLYTVDANYLASGQKITVGKKKIRENFGIFFESIKKDGKTMTISFQILQREVDKKIGYDVGIYKITTFIDGKKN
jgi:ketosteroid isomerase-like protein